MSSCLKFNAWNIMIFENLISNLIISYKQRKIAVSIPKNWFFLKKRGFEKLPYSPSFLWIWYILHCCIEIERGDERVDYIPGLSSTLIADFPPLLHNHNPVLARILQAFSCLPRAHCLLLTSVYELEAQVIDALKSIFSSPIYPIGPVIPYYKLGDSSSVTTGSDNLNYLQWLDSQPCHSVLYISFGSVLSVSSAQTDEIAAGLRDSGVRFLWVARGEASRLREVCGEMGLVVPWCDQLKVLSHSSVGGFWTHCGWNSTVEGLFSGLPFLTFPIALDQFSNSRAAVEDWKIGWRVKRQAGVETLVLREEIAELLKRFMDLESHEGKEMRRRARKVQKICEEATANGGSSETNMDAFTREITQLLLPSHEEIWTAYQSLLYYLGNISWLTNSQPSLLLNI